MDMRSTRSAALPVAGPFRCVKRKLVGRFQLLVIVESETG